MEVAFTLPYWSIPAFLSFIAVALALFMPVRSNGGNLGVVDFSFALNYIVRFLALVFALALIWCLHFIAELTLLASS